MTDLTEQALTWSGAALLAMAGTLWAYLRPIPRQVCDERHARIEQALAELKTDIKEILRRKIDG